jgi:hypothetical protein
VVLVAMRVQHVMFSGLNRKNHNQRRPITTKLGMKHARRHVAGPDRPLASELTTVLCHGMFGIISGIE